MVTSYVKMIILCSTMGGYQALFLVISTLSEVKGVSERFFCYYGHSLSQKDDLNIFSND